MEQFEQTLQNTVRNVKILACEGMRIRNLANKKVVVISEEKNIYYEHTYNEAESSKEYVCATTSVLFIESFAGCEISSQ